MFCSTRVQELLHLDQRVGLPSLKSCDGAKLRADVVEVNRDIKGIQTHNITVLSNLKYEAAYGTTERMGLLIEKRRKRTE